MERLLIIIFILTDVKCYTIMGWRGGRGDLVEEGQTEGGQGGEFSCWAAVGALSRADGLQHSPFSLLKHVLLKSGTEI